MYRIWINAIVVFLLFLSIGGCATNKEKLLSHNDHTMLDIWNQQTGSHRIGRSDSPWIEARQILWRPIIDADKQAVLTPANVSYTRTAKNEIDRQFQRLPNPDLVMYVFPHLAGTEQVPVPGYSTVFPFYQRVQYALPGERVKDF